MKTLSIGLAFMALASTAAAESYLIKGADIYSAGEQLRSTDLYIANGRVEAIGKNLAMAADTTIDATGKSVTAGLFNSLTHLGAVEVGAIEPTADFYTTNTAVTAALKVGEAFNPNSTLIPHNRAHGLTHALLVPAAGTGLFAGQVALVELSMPARVLNDSVAVAVDFSEHGVELVGSSRAAALVVLRQALDDAKDFAANKSAALAGDRRDYSISFADLAALEPVVNGQKPLLVKTHRASDIRSILKLAKHYGLKLILSGVTEGWMVAAEIASAGVPVIMDPIENLPGSYESLGARLDNAKLLSDAGVTLLFTGMSWHNTHNAYLVRQSAGNAVANGLDKSIAIAAMTSNPAKLFKATVSGDISRGGIANLVLWSGDPLEVTSEAELVLVAGARAPMVTRATQLRDRYFQRLQK